MLLNTQLKSTRARSIQLSVIFMVLTVLVAACNGGGGSGGGSSQSNIPSDAIQVRFVYGSEKQDWVEAVTKTFNAGGKKTASGKPIYVTTKAEGSGESMDDITSGAEKPALWGPASNVWLPLMNDAWTLKSGKPLVNTDQCKSVVVSPLVIMMWKDRAQALGWPEKPIGWGDIKTLSTTSKSTFRFGHTHPDYSNSGLMTVIAMTYAAVNKQVGLTKADVQAEATGKYMQDLESSIAHYGSSTGFFGTNMIKRGPDYLTAAVVYESVVVGSYDPTKRNPDFPDLVAIYPKEGTFLSDHPVCIPDESWVSADQKEAAGIYRDYLLSSPIQQQALQYGFRPADPSISLSTPLDTAHGVNPAKFQNVLEAPSADVIAAIKDLWKIKKRQVNLTLLVDVSGSMADQGKIDKAREGVKGFIDNLNPSDNLTLVKFDDRQDIVFQNQTVGDANNRASLKAQVDQQLQPRGSTAIYDSIAFALNLMKNDPTRINAIVLMTDGADNDSQKFRTPNSLSSIIGSSATGNGADVLVFTIGYGSDVKSQDLSTIADIGRGSYTAAGTADIADIFRQISTFF